MTTSVASYNPYEIEQRRKQFHYDMQPFAQMLYKLYAWMPAKMIVNFETKELTDIIDPEWQAKIDEVMK